ncbi:Uncharacterised protein [BD1-7 clade bacterium]|uniref:Transposase n=1 Tax=BD1-7 clade bacterium TaxID=2029982 RepID=A0A5S9P6H4_9GAMM|nr:Uncharacterised protein [BD1-7 clade bacterium]
MAKIKSAERTAEYSKDFKVAVVKLTNELDVKGTEIAQALNLHPVMVYRWRQEHRKGKFVAQASRKISMTKKPSIPAEDKALKEELKRLRKENAALEKESRFLKKWDEYLKEQKPNDSNS